MNMRQNNYIKKKKKLKCKIDSINFTKIYFSNLTLSSVNLVF